MPIIVTTIQQSENCFNIMTNNITIDTNIDTDKTTDLIKRNQLKDLYGKTLQDYIPNTWGVWASSRWSKIKTLENIDKGKVAEEFIVKCCNNMNGLAACIPNHGKGGFDVRVIDSATSNFLGLEVKFATSSDVKTRFQFNSIDDNAKFTHLLVLGLLAPDDLRYRILTEKEIKDIIKSGRSITRMDKVTTKKVAKKVHKTPNERWKFYQARHELKEIEYLEQDIRAALRGDVIEPIIKHKQ